MGWKNYLDEKIEKDDDKLSDTEIRILRNLHLKGVIGNTGNLKPKQRLKILQKLIDDGYITKSCILTKKGIEVSSPRRS